MFRTLAIAITSLGLLAPVAVAAEHTPVLFVHGLEGTGAQFQSQKLRLTSNGYPHELIDEVDYNSLVGAGNRTAVHGQIDAKIAELRQRAGTEQVDVVGHSLGTIVMESYLEDAERRAGVRRYVNIDGQDTKPDVPTLAVWAGKNNEDAKMEGAENVTVPNQTHVQVCTSKETFQALFAFLTGKAPKHGIVRQRGVIEVAGRAVTFPQNEGLAGAVVYAWPLTADGTRASATPAATADITDGSEGGGDFGPLRLRAGRPYEFEVVRAGRPTRHLYFEPFVRSDYTLRLLASDVIGAYTGGRTGSMSVSQVRYKELWGNVEGETDELRINGLSVCTATLCPWTKQVNAFFAFDRNLDGQSDLTTPDPVVGNLPFISAADVFVAASTPPDATATFELFSRGATTPRTIRMPNWEAANDGVTIQWNDFEPAEVEAVCPRKVTLRVRRPTVRSIVAYAGGRRVGRSRGKRSVRVPSGARKVRLRITTGGGRVIQVTRRVRACA